MVALLFIITVWKVVAEIYVLKTHIFLHCVCRPVCYCMAVCKFGAADSDFFVCLFRSRSVCFEGGKSKELPGFCRMLVGQVWESNWTMSL